jgi:hypothetical protein
MMDEDDIEFIHDFMMTLKNLSLNGQFSDFNHIHHEVEDGRIVFNFDAPNRSPNTNVIYMHEYKMRKNAYTK